METFTLSQAQQDELRTAARQAAGMPLTELTPESLPLPTAAAVLSPAQLEAMAVLDQLNSDPRFSVTMDLRPGDMQFLNNHVTLHSRTAYEDYPEPERRRDLIRLWLNGTASRTALPRKRRRGEARHR